MKNSSPGFTLVQMLTAMAVIVILGGVTIVGVTRYGSKARDTERIAAFQNQKKALALYRQQFGHYPSAGGDGKYGYTYNYRDRNGTCQTTANLQFDNSFSDGGIGEFMSGVCLVDETECDEDSDCSSGECYSFTKTFADPLGGNSGGARKYNCVYIIEQTSDNTCGSGGVGSGDDPCKTTWNEIQKYYMRCAVENDENELAFNDGGYRDDLYEVFEPYPWLCIGGFESNWCSGYNCVTANRP